MKLSAIVRKDGNQFVSWCPEYDIASQGKTIKAALMNLKEAVELYLEDEDAPKPRGAPIITSIEVRNAKAARPLRA